MRLLQVSQRRIQQQQQEKGNQYDTGGAQRTLTCKTRRALAVQPKSMSHNEYLLSSRADFYFHFRLFDGAWLSRAYRAWKTSFSRSPSFHFRISSLAY